MLLGVGISRHTHTHAPSPKEHMQSEWGLLYTCKWGQSLSIPSLWYYDRL